MSLSSVADRFAKLRAMRESLCKKENEWHEAFKAKDWVILQLKDLLVMANDKDLAREEVVNRIEDLLCVLDPSGCVTGDSDDE
jgi:hypothetical protein